MKRLILTLIVLVPMITYGSITDSSEIGEIQKEITRIKSTVTNLKQEKDEIIALYQQQNKIIDSLKSIQNKQADNVDQLANKVGRDISVANQKIETNVNKLSRNINNNKWLTICGILFAIALLGVIYFILRKKILSGASSIDKIKAAQDSLEAAQKAMQEESIKLDNKLVELLDKQINSTPKQETSAKPDHSFALKVGNEIAKIETNLSKMDPEVKGYRQLKQALKRIKDNFNSHGYEIVELLGQDYNDGMPFEAQFVPDENLPEGKRIISGITRLQINYNGEMIQSAKIVVRQNI